LILKFFYNLKEFNFNQNFGFLNFSFIKSIFCIFGLFLISFTYIRVKFLLFEIIHSSSSKSMLRVCFKFNASPVRNSIPIFSISKNIAWLKVSMLYSIDILHSPHSQYNLNNKVDNFLFIKFFFILYQIIDTAFHQRLNNKNLDCISSHCIFLLTHVISKTSYKISRGTFFHAIMIKSA
jgi:hypothetical protein